MKTILFKILILFMIIAASQISVFADSQDRNLYVQKFEEDFQTALFINRNVLRIDVQEKDNIMFLEPDTPIQLSFGLGWKWIFFAYSFAASGARIDAQDIQMYMFPKQWIISLFWQEYQKLKSDDSTYASNMSIKREGLSIEYVFNDELSLAASFKQSKKQLKSAGSFLLGATIHYNELRNETRQDYWRFGPMIGYAYTYVFAKDFYITGVLSAGVNVLDSPRITYGNNKAEYDLIFLPKLALGYSAQTWGIVVSYIFDNNISGKFDRDENSSKDESVKSFAESGQFSIGFYKRFNLFNRNKKGVENEI
ncbi:MAG: DUF4421 domain-containing protein [Elusimicrobiota bacterium]|jgi:hypothetical protein|nr:DUF4421 domain-containing protein [Elusimicrobiota bacterium]